MWRIYLSPQNERASPFEYFWSLANGGTLSVRHRSCKKYSTRHECRSFRCPSADLQQAVTFFNEVLGRVSYPPSKRGAGTKTSVNLKKAFGVATDSKLKNAMLRLGPTLLMLQGHGWTGRISSRCR